MKFERTKNSTRTFAFGVINKLITVLCPFITRTIIIYKLGAEYLGLTSLFTSVLTILNVSELGISSAVSFCLYKPIAEDDKDTINALMNFMKKIYRVIGILILTVGLCLMPFLDKIISGTYPEGMNIYILYVLYLLNSVVSYLGFAYKSVLFEAYQHGDVNHKILSVVEIIKYVVQIAVLLVLENYYIYVVILPISSIMTTLITEQYSKKYFPGIVPKGELSKDYRKLIKNKVSYLAAHSIAAT
jgi:Na+-driven multidrug efflux pump